MTELGVFLRTKSYADIIGIHVSDPYTGVVHPFVAVKLGKRPKFYGLIVDDKIPTGMTHGLIINPNNWTKTGKYGILEVRDTPEIALVSESEYIELWYKLVKKPKRLQNISSEELNYWIISMAQTNSDVILRSGLDDSDKTELILDDLNFGSTSKWLTFRDQLRNSQTQ